MNTEVQVDMGLMEAIFHRRAVRHYSERTVEAGTVEQLLAAAVQAPSAMNLQPWAFAVFHGQRNLEWMYLKNTPTSLLVRTLPEHLLYNAAAAIHFARIGCFGAYLRAKVAALAGLPGLLRKRTAIQASRRVGASALTAVMETRWLATKLREKQFDVGMID